MQLYQGNLNREKAYYLTQYLRSERERDYTELPSDSEPEKRTIPVLDLFAITGFNRGENLCLNFH